MVWITHTQESKYLGVTSNIYSTAKAFHILTNQFNGKKKDTCCQNSTMEWENEIQFRKQKLLHMWITHCQRGPSHRTFYRYGDKL